MKNIAIVGFGFMGMTHALNILKNDNLRLAAIVDKDLEGIERKLTSPEGNFSTGNLDPEQLASVNKYRDLGECIENETIDAVYVCVHTDLHYLLAKQAMEAGLHVFLEKPMTLDVTLGQELIGLAEKNSLIFMVGHVLRFMSPYEKLKKWVDEKTYGELNFLSLTRFSGVPAWGQWKEKQKAYGSSGGALFDLLIHDIDFAQYLLGGPDDITSMYFPGALSEYDYISAYWNFEKRGIKVKIEGGNTFHSQFPFQASYMADFEKASIMYTTLQPAVIKVADDEKMTEIDAEEGRDGFYNEDAYFAQCIEEGRKPDKCLPESALETIRICYEHLNDE